MITYTITCTEEQAALIQQALEHLPGWHDDKSPLSWNEKHRIRHQVDRITGPLRPAGHGGDGGAWDAMQPIRHRLAWDRAYAAGIIKPGEPRKWPEMMGVLYDEPLLRGDGPALRIERVDSQEKQGGDA